MADLHDFVAKKDKKKKGTKMLSKVNTDVMAKNLEETASKEQKQNQDKEITNTGDVEESSYVPSSETMTDNECKLFIYGVDTSYKEQELQDQFEKFGPVTDTHNTGKGYAFLTFADKSSAQTAIQEMDGAIVNGKNIQVHKFKAKEGSRHGDRKHGGRKDFVAKLDELSLVDRKSNSGPDENIEQFSGGLICMDLLNFCRSFFTILKGPKSKYISFENDLRTAQSKAARFVKAATASGFELICFIDKGISTLEAINKWLSRRMKDLEKGRRDVVASMNLFMGNMFARLGVPVHYSTVDCDDTIAAFAHHHGGCVLSQDADFFRYYVDNNNADAASQVSVPPYKVYSDFQIKKGKLILKRQFEPASKKPRTPRKILEELPETVTDNSFVLCSVPSGTLGWKGGIALMRGCGSNLTHLTNPHLQVRPLRQALYSRLGIKSMREMIAVWDSHNQVGTFTEDDVTCDPALDHLLDSPQEAFTFMFGESQSCPPGIRKQEWRNHIFCQKVVVAVLCAWASHHRGTGGDLIATMDMIKQQE